MTMERRSFLKGAVALVTLTTWARDWPWERFQELTPEPMATDPLPPLGVWASLMLWGNRAVPKRVVPWKRVENVQVYHGRLYGDPVRWFPVTASFDQVVIGYHSRIYTAEKFDMMYTATNGEITCLWDPGGIIRWEEV